MIFDNEGGGRAAADHLLRQGHRAIAFLGLHGGSEHQQLYEYSAHRALGWADALRNEGISSDGFLFIPDKAPASQQAEVAVAAETAKALVARSDVTAVVGANDHALLGLIQRLRQAAVPTESWPAVVGFDGTLEQRSHTLTSIRLPWEEVGRVAADMLWERKTGQRSGAAQHRSIPMMLIPRLSSQPSWSPGLGV